MVWEGQPQPGVTKRDDTGNDARATHTSFLKLVNDCSTTDLVHLVEGVVGDRLVGVDDLVELLRLARLSHRLKK